MKFKKKRIRGTHNTPSPFYILIIYKRVGVGVGVWWGVLLFVFGGGGVYICVCVCMCVEVRVCVHVYTCRCLCAFSCDYQSGWSATWYVYFGCGIVSVLSFVV